MPIVGKNSAKISVSQLCIIFAQILRFLSFVSKAKITLLSPFFETFSGKQAITMMPEGSQKCYGSLILPVQVFVCIG